MFIVTDLVSLSFKTQQQQQQQQRQQQQQQTNYNKQTSEYGQEMLQSKLYPWHHEEETHNTNSHTSARTQLK